ncbi:hypothetical protein THAOC_13208, partial [Thalassiosira oceanica]
SDNMRRFTCKDNSLRGGRLKANNPHDFAALLLLSAYALPRASNDA